MKDTCHYSALVKTERSLMEGVLKVMRDFVQVSGDIEEEEEEEEEGEGRGGGGGGGK